VKTFSLEENIERGGWLAETRQRRVSGVVVTMVDRIVQERRGRQTKEENISIKVSH
jgi:hypothetical protein